MVPYKRPAADKSGVPVYQPNATTYQQLMQLQQPFVPVSCEYSASPTPAPATSAASPPIVESQTLSSNTIPKESEIAQTSTTQAQAVPVPSIPPPQIPDPAALAKEVAQQNYAKAIKLAAVSQSYATSMNHLNPLNYTGVSLNKQTMTIPPPTLARYPNFQNFGLGASGLGIGLTNPYAALPQTSLFNLTRPPPSATIINPYSFMRTPYATAASPQLLSAGLIGAQYQPLTVAATPITNVPATTQIAAAAAQNNNNVVMQPFKKLKTT